MAALPLVGSGPGPSSSTASASALSCKSASPAMILSLPSSGPTASNANRNGPSTSTVNNSNAKHAAADSAALKCAIHTPQLGLLVISSDANDSSRPDVRSLAALIMPRGGIAGAGAGRGDDEEGNDGVERSKEVPLFRRERGSANMTKEALANHGIGDDGCGGGGMSAASAHLLNLVPDLPGLEERLGDAAAAGPSDDAGYLEKFLTRSEAVVSELFSAIEQHRSSRHRLERKFRGGGGKKRKRRSVSGADAARHANNYGGMAAPPPPVHLSHSSASALLRQLTTLETLPDIKTVDLSDNLSRVMVTCTDDAGREHDLTIAELSSNNLPPPAGGGRSSGPVFLCDLPIDFEPQWRRDDGGSSGNDKSADDNRRYGLPSVYLQFREALVSYQTLWDDLDEIDETAWVLEPSLPARRSIAERRLAVRPNLSVVVSLDAERSRGLPIGIRLVGASGDADELRERVRRYFDMADDGSSGGWDEAKSTKANLEACFGFALPSPETTEKADYVAECAVCYSHRLFPAGGGDEEDGGGGGGGAGSLPDASCGNPSCARSYHESCLFEWLASLPGARVSFDRIFGTCPYCSEPVSARVLSGTGTGAGGGGGGGAS